MLQSSLTFMHLSFMVMTELTAAIKVRQWVNKIVLLKRN
jgi:hypothetical protein